MPLPPPNIGLPAPVVDQTDTHDSAAPTQTAPQKRNYTSGAMMPVNLDTAAQLADSPEKTIFDYTAGAAAYGGATAGGALARKFGLDDLANNLEMFKEQNPQYAPDRVDHFYNLITSPGALVSNVAAGVPQFAATAGLMAIPYVGVPLAAGLSYSIDSQEQYDQAKAVGASEDEAVKAGRISGGISAALNLIPASKMLRGVLGGKTELARIAFKDTLDEAVAAKLPQEVAHNLATQQLANALGRKFEEVSDAEVRSILSSQGNWTSNLVRKIAPESTYTTNVLDFLEKPAVSGALSLGGWNVVGGSATTLANQSIYGEHLPDFNWKDFLDQQAQSFLTGAATHVFLGIPSHEIGKQITKVKPLTFDYTQLQNDLVSKDAFYNQFLGKMTEDQRKVAEPLFDNVWQQVADANGFASKEKALNQFLVLSKQTLDVDGTPLAQSVDKIPGMFSALEKYLNDDKEFQKVPNMPASQFLSMLQKPKTGVTAEELKWTGLRDALTALGNKSVNIDTVRQIMDGKYVQILRSVRSQEDANKAAQQIGLLRGQREELYRKENALAYEHESAFDNLEKLRNDPNADPQALQEAQQDFSTLDSQLTPVSQKIQEIDARIEKWRTDVVRPQHSDIAPKGLDKNFTEIVVHLPIKTSFDGEPFLSEGEMQQRETELQSARGQSYISGHFPETPNYLMDVSLGSGDVKLPTGQVVSVRGIIEAQSDRAQQLREVLQRLGGKSFDELSKEDKALADEHSQLLQKLQKGDGSYNQDDFNRVLEIEQARRDLTPKLLEAQDNNLDGPMMQDAKTWVKHLVKQSLLDSVERGYNYFLLPDPEQVADRWHDRGEPEWQGLKTFYENMVNPIAEKLFKQYDPKHPGSVMGELVGGEKVERYVQGKNFQRVIQERPEYAADLQRAIETRTVQKEFDGEDLVQQGILAKETGAPRQYKTLEITPAVRDRVLSGQPLFQPLLDKSPVGLNNWLRQTAANSPYGKAKGVLMKDGHIYLSDADDHALILKTLERKGYSIRDVEGTLYIDAPREGSTKAPLALVDRDAASQFYGALPEGHGSSFISLDNPKNISYVKGTEYFAQPFNGSTTFLRDQNDVVRAFVEMSDTANFSTPWHELAHVLTKFSTPEQQDIMSKMVGKDFGHWGTAEWEKIAKSFEAYMLKGEAPNAALQPFFNKAEGYMREVYKNVRNKYIQDQVTPHALAIFDNWFAKSDPKVKAALDWQRTVFDKYVEAEAYAKDLTKKQPGSQQTSLANQQAEQLGKMLQTARETYRELQVSQRTRESEVERRANATEDVYTQKLSESPEQTARRSYIGDLWKSMQGLWSFENVLKSNAFGNELVQRTNSAFADAQRIKTPIMLEAEESLKSAGAKTLATLSEPTDVGGKYKTALFTKLRLMDGNSPDRYMPPSGSADSVVAKVFYKANYTLNKLAENLGMTRTYSEGTVEPVRAGENQIDSGMKNLRIPRIFDKYFRERWNFDPQFQKAVRDGILEANPSTYKGPKDVEGLMNFIDGLVKNPDIRKSQSLEYGRAIPNMPDAVRYNGKVVPILETHAGELLSRTIHSQSNRIAWVKQFGQGVLAKANIAHWATFANKIFEANVKFTGEHLREKLRAFKDSEGNKIVDSFTLDQMNMSQMKSLAKEYGIKAGLTDKDYYEATKDYRAADLLNKDGTPDKNKVKQLQSLAKALKGVTVEQPLPDLVEEVRSRLLETPIDVMEKLKQGYIESGGKDLQTWDRYVALAQGIDPYQVRSGPIGRFYNNLRGLMGALNTGLVGVPYYATQAFNMMPVRASGIFDLFENFRKTILNPQLTQEMMKEFGVMLEPGTVFRRDLGLSGWGGKAYDFAYNYLGLKKVDQVSFGLATRMAATWADRMNENMSRADLNAVKRLRLSPKEVEQLQNHAMDDVLKTKIVRGFVDSSLIYSSPSFKKGFLDTHPVAKMLLSYNSYAVGMARYMGDFTTEVVDAIKSGDSTAKAGAAVKLVSLIGAAVGSAYMASVLSQAVKLNASKQATFKPEDTPRELASALVDFGLLGPLMKFKFALGADGGDTHNILSFLMPQFDTLANVSASLMSTTAAPQGKYANYGFAERLLRTLGDESPEWKIYKQLDQAFRTPNGLAYNEAFSEAEDFKERMSRKTGIAKASESGFQNPLIKPIYDDIKNQDLDSAMADLGKYYETMYKRATDMNFIENGLDPNKIKTELRSSLMAKAPLEMGPIELGTFLSKYDSSSAAHMYKADAMYRSFVDALVPAGN